MGVSGDDIGDRKRHSGAIPSPIEKSTTMPISLKHVALALAGGAVAATISAPPMAAADPSPETCTNLGSSATRCQSPGNAEINDSLPYANVLPEWSFFGGQSGGPYGGPGGGAG
jgi:hypothetical protein